MLIARNLAIDMPDYVHLALDNGVKPSEVSEMITHLAFYSGWENAMSAVAATRSVFAQRGINANELPAASPKLLPLNEAAEAQRESRNADLYAAVAPGVLQYTTDVLFRDLWLRPALAPRDRSLVTVSALVASGQVAQVSYHLNRAMDSGLTRRKQPRCSRNSRSTRAGRTSSRRCRSRRTSSRNGADWSEPCLMSS